MDKTVAKIYNFSREIAYGVLDHQTVDEIKKRIMDIIITSYAARNSTPVRLIKDALLPRSSGSDSTVFFTPYKAAPEIAAFINGTMTRYHDYNDTYLSKEALHPSDNIPPLVSMAESRGMAGKDLIASISVAYAVIAGLADAVCIRDRGWDHVTYISISSAAGLSNLIGLDREQFENAISLSINNNISLRQTRAGELSMWKGATAANACRNSLFSVLLAEKGFTGPSEIFSGEMGFFRQVSGEFDLSLDVNAVRRTMIKNYPVEYHSMSAAEVASDLRKEIKGKIQHIRIDTFSVAHKIIVKDPEKLRPKTKETADHSLPYIVAYTLAYGDPDTESYSERYLNDNRILDLIDRTEIQVDRDFDRTYPGDLPVRITVETDSGKFSREMRYPKGHYMNPYSWDDLESKGISVMGESLYRSALAIIKDLENRKVSDLTEVISHDEA
ncbi:MAG: MmgE/PrpD family protein [Candidatus Thermoplasmatota archaeon]|nr:MmgE/PrpD family protein [Candidatus Thermoplasmatota archaeon]MCL5731149.1 MmgE/PrpD family protein [Candidatus Thermoplasmatota archaeon]